MTLLIHDLSRACDLKTCKHQHFMSGYIHTLPEWCHHMVVHGRFANISSQSSLMVHKQHAAAPAETFVYLLRIICCVRDIHRHQLFGTGLLLAAESYNHSVEVKHNVCVMSSDLDQLQNLNSTCCTLYPQSCRQTVQTNQLTGPERWR